MILREIAYQRSGDKGDDVAVAFFPHDDVELERLIQNLTEDRVRAHLTKYPYDALKINVYEKLGFVQLVFSGILEGGVSVNKKMDRNGKALGDVLLEMQAL